MLDREALDMRDNASLKTEAGEIVDAKVEAADGVDVVPDGGYGWCVAAAVCSINASSWGINQGFGVYISYFIQHSYYPGGTTLRYAFTGGLTVASAMACAPLANFLSKRYGFRTPLLTGVVTCVLGQCMAGIAPNFGLYMFCQGFLFGTGLGLTMIPGQPLLSHWFEKRLALAQALGGSGAGLGGLIFSNTTRLAIDRVGLKWSMVINGCISLVVLVPSILVLKGRKKDARTEPLQLSYLWHPGFIWIWTWGACAMMTFFIGLYSAASYATNGLGLTQTQGAMISSLLSAGALVGRIFCGWALDKVGRVNGTILFQLIAGISSLAIWLPSRSLGVLILYAILIGSTGGMVWSSAPPIIKSTIGVQNMGSALGLFWLTLCLPTLVAQPIAVLLLDYSRTHLGRTGASAYSISIGFCGGLSIFSAVLLVGVKVYLQKSWKVWIKT